MDFRKPSSEVLKEMLDTIDNSYEKSKGYFLWDILKAVAIQIKQVLEKVQIVLQHLNVEELSGNELERFINQRTGITRKAATYASGVITVFGNGIVREGDFFETPGFVRYKALETVQIANTGEVRIQAIVPGAAGNVPIGAVTKMPITIQGVTGCYNALAVEGGYDEEPDKDFLARYYERLRTPATSGNAFHYRRWALETPGVGDARVFPLWAGNNTVKVVIIDQNRLPASVELVNTVQTYIDPNVTGTGAGEAPVGAFCTVESAKAKTINISVQISLISGYEIATVIENIKDEIRHYLASIAFQKNYLSYAIAGANILNADGVSDYKNLLLNGLQQNIECAADEVMILGECVISG